MCGPNERASQHVAPCLPASCSTGQHAGQLPPATGCQPGTCAEAVRGVGPAAAVSPKPYMLPPAVPPSCRPAAGSRAKVRFNGSLPPNATLSASVCSKQFPSMRQQFSFRAAVAGASALCRHLRSPPGILQPGCAWPLPLVAQTRPPPRPPPAHAAAARVGRAGAGRGCQHGCHLRRPAGLHTGGAKRHPAAGRAFAQGASPAVAALR